VLVAAASVTPHGIQVAHWLAWADRDYLAARDLLLRRFVLQGATLANTAIEKYLKAALVVKNISFRNSHDVVALHQQLKSNAPKLPAVNTAFLGLLVKAYKLRYPDDLPVGFNIALASAKILRIDAKTISQIG
jgi:HEPN domain-containing protein